MVYICTTNFISLLMSFVMNANSVKKMLNIPVLSEHEQRELKESTKNQKNLIDGFKESWQNQKIMSEVREREQLRAKQFDQAGTRVPQKTFKTNPKSKE
jgi:hypothetical protein